jgi:glycosyltransferase 2 family protein
MDKIRKFEGEIIFSFVLGAIVASLLAFWGDVGETVGQLVTFNWWLAVPVLILTCFNYFLRFLRWHFFLKKVGFKKTIEPRESGLIFLSGLPLTLSPGKTGEVLKAYFLKRITGDHLSRTIPVVIAERLTDGLGALILLAFGFSTYQYGWLAIFFALISCGVFIFVVYSSFAWKIVTTFIEKASQKRPFLAKINYRLASFRKVLLDLISWKSLTGASLLAATAWFAEAVGFSIIISSVSGINISFALLSQTVFIFCFVSILGFISFIPGGIGIAEGGFVGLLVLLLSLNPPQAAAATILLRLLTLWWGVGIGLVAFFYVLGRFKQRGQI